MGFGVGGRGGGVTQKKRLKRGGHPKKNGGGVTRNILVHVELI